MRHTREADRLARELTALQSLAGRRGIALVEHQVQHVQYDTQTRITLIVGR